MVVRYKGRCRKGGCYGSGIWVGVRMSQGKKVRVRVRVEGGVRVRVRRRVDKGVRIRVRVEMRVR